MLDSRDHFLDEFTTDAFALPAKGRAGASDALGANTVMRSDDPWESGRDVLQAIVHKDDGTKTVLAGDTDAVNGLGQRTGVEIDSTAPGTTTNGAVLSRDNARAAAVIEAGPGAREKSSRAGLPKDLRTTKTSE